MAPMASDAPKKKSQKPLARAKGSKGCSECTKRKTSCDKDLPACFPCVIYGTKCSYAPGPSTEVAKSQSKSSLKADTTERLLGSLALCISAGPVADLPVDMPFRSSEVFYHFIKNRTMLARVIYRDENHLNASLGLTQTDQTWFQMALCLTASYRSLGGRGEFQDTLLYHRQNLLRWINERLLAVRGPVPAAYLSMIISMIKADSAAGEDTSVAAHVKGVLSILEARRNQINGWCFYDDLAKRVMMIGLGLVFVLRQSAMVNNNAGLDPLIGSMYTQLANEFLRPFVLTGSPNAASRTDGPILTWLYRALQECRLRRQKRPGLGTKTERLAGLEYREGFVWLKATCAYALTVGTVDWFETDGSEGEGEAPKISESLKRLREWSSRTVAAWLATGKPMTQSIARQVWEKITWFESDEGLRVLREITMQAQCDGVYLGEPEVQELVDPGKARDLIYI
ncbi:hypothetical protein GQ53DRAFT_741978 [Thozetella sp. PMI_491]|nr:hypothetical protein GQ53DRAFT_741978 [Thozetella sp. PMI_491]